jgi:hypothetical protein
MRAALFFLLRFPLFLSFFDVPLQKIITLHG